MTDRRELFGRAVGDYDAGRPPYPELLWDVLVQRCAVGPGIRVLEIGPGTGQATGRLLGLGARVTAVELDQGLASFVTSRFARSDLEVVIGTFETAPLPPAGFDLLAAATSFHWVDPAVGLQRAAEVLAPGGWLALWWNVFGDPTRPDPFGEALPSLLATFPDLEETTGPGALLSGAHPYSLDKTARIAEIDATAAFGPVHHETIPWTARHTPAQLRSLFGSYSSWLAIPESIRTKLLDALERLAVDDFGGMVERPYLTSIYLAQRLTATATREPGESNL